MNQMLSGSVNGEPINVHATADPGTIIHQNNSRSADTHEVWISAFNFDTVSGDLTIEFGNGAVSSRIKQTLTSNTGLVLVIPGLPLGFGGIVRAFASSADKIGVTGFFNVSPTDRTI